MEEDKDAGRSDAQGEAFNYDDILEHLGQMGRFQMRNFLWLCLPAIFPGFITMSLSFTGGVPNYRSLSKSHDVNSILLLIFLSRLNFPDATSTDVMTASPLTE